MPCRSTFGFKWPLGSSFDVSFIYPKKFLNRFLKFQHQLTYFDLTFIQNFKRLLGSSFFKCLEVFFKKIVNKTFSLGFIKGVSFISIKAIGELKACGPNHYIHIHVGLLPIFIRS